MFKFRINIYTLPESLVPAKNYLYVHGFTMHDRNYALLPLVQNFAQTKGHNLSVFNPNNDNLADFLNQAPELMSKLGRDFFQQSKLITISFSYEDNALSVAQVVEVLKTLLAIPTEVSAYSYGVPSMQLFYAGLAGYGEGLASEPKLYFAQALHRDKNSAQAHPAIKNLEKMRIVRGSIMPVSADYGIPPRIAKLTEKTWTCESLIDFGKTIGLPKEELELLANRISTVKPKVIASQKETLLYMIELMPYFKHFFAQEELRAGWTYIQAAKQDAIYPYANICNLAQALNLELQTTSADHYIYPKEIFNLIFN